MWVQSLKTFVYITIAKKYEYDFPSIDHTQFHFLWKLPLHGVKDHNCYILLF